MRIIDITHPPQSLWIGREGENTFRPVSFECANWFSAYPDATIAAYYQPYGAADPYPLVLVEDGTKRIWHPLLNELVKGDGELQIALMQGDTVGTSAIIPTKVDRSLISNGDHPASESPSWAVEVVQDVTEQADRAEEAARRAEEAGGDVDPEQIAEAVENYFDEHPVVVEETDPNAVHFDTPQTLTPAQKAQARTNVGAGTYSKPSGGIPASDLASDVQTSLGKADSAYQKPGGGIPASDLASGVIPTVPTAEISANTAARHTHSNKTLLDTYTQTEANLADAVSKKHSHSNKTVLDGITAAKVQSWDGKGTYSKPSGGIPKSDLASAVQTSLGKADTALQEHQSLAGYATESYVQTQIANIPDELPAVTASDNGKFLRVVNGAWAAESVPAAESNSFGGGS